MRAERSGTFSPDIRNRASAPDAKVIIFSIFLILLADPPAMKNHLLKIAGGLCVALGFIGAFVPLLPTMPFLLPAAYCFSKSDPALRRRLFENRLSGP